MYLASGGDAPAAGEAGLQAHAPVDDQHLAGRVPGRVAAANSSAVASPMPESAPVTIAVFPASLCIGDGPVLTIRP
jgi:hypothetical protein